jgi:hypothetical protein
LARGRRVRGGPRHLGRASRWGRPILLNTDGPQPHGRTLAGFIGLRHGPSVTSTTSRRRPPSVILRTYTLSHQRSTAGGVETLHANQQLHEPGSGWVDRIPRSAQLMQSSCMGLGVCNLSPWVQPALIGVGPTMSALGLHASEAPCQPIRVACLKLSVSR